MMKRTNFYLTEAQIKGLKKISTKTGAPVSVLIRRAIDAYVKRPSSKKTG